MIDRDIQFAHHRWLKTQIRLASKLAIADTDGLAVQTNDFLWDTIQESHSEHTYHVWNKVNLHSAKW